MWPPPLPWLSGNRADLSWVFGERNFMSQNSSRPPLRGPHRTPSPTSSRPSLPVPPAPPPAGPLPALLPLVCGPCSLPGSAKGGVCLPDPLSHLWPSTGEGLGFLSGAPWPLAGLSCSCAWPEWSWPAAGKMSVSLQLWTLSVCSGGGGRSRELGTFLSR